MNSKLKPPPSLKRSKAWRLALVGPCVMALASVAAGCSPPGSRGQVIATVNGEEITPQDLEAEARSNPALAQADTSVLLQRVIARALLAEAAHNRGIDHYPGYPSDIARLKKDFIAQRFMRSNLKPPPTPTPADLQKIMAANPYSFAQRQSVTVDDIGMQLPAGNAQSIETLRYPNDIVARLTRLSIPHSRRTVVLDTSKVPTALAERLVAEPLGQVFFVRNDSHLAAMTVTARVPIVVPPEDAAAAATEIFQSTEVQQQVDSLVAQLRSQAKIVYINGFTPPQKADPAAGRNVSGPSDGAAH